MRWNIQAKAFDQAGNSRYTATLGINAIDELDSDGDGIPDSLDWWPDDPAQWTSSNTNQNDTLAPTITITEP
jgi:hypothetical protein